MKSNHLSDPDFSKPLFINDLTILVPFYNEAERLPELLRRVLQFLDAKMFICVNDGSKDDGEKIIKDKFPNVKLINLPKNSGKSHAVRAGLDEVKTEYVMLLDADLIGLNAKQLAEGILRFHEALRAGKKIDMLIFRRSDDPLHYKLVRADVLFSGERILRTDVLKEIYKNRQFTKYQIEMFINDVMNEIDAQVYWVPLQSKNPDKIAKWQSKHDAIQGTVDLMVGTLSKAETIAMLTKQYLKFGKKEL